MPEREPTPDGEPSTSLRADRRAFVRVASDLIATCSTGARRQEVSWPGTVHDVSQGGIGLILRHRFTPGMRLLVELRESTGTLVRHVAARVVHVRPVLFDGNHCWQTGCAFDEPLSEEELQTLV
jgi:hypothetical protein